MSFTYRDTALTRAVRLAALLPRRPAEFYDRVLALVTVRTERAWGQRPAYDLAASDSVIPQLGATVGAESGDYAAEGSLTEIESEVRARVEAMGASAPIPLEHNAGYVLARLVYIACRMLRPSVVVETGVAYGISSAFILRALELNNRGHLYSIDLPPLRPNSERFIGAAIPEGLRHRWSLHVGASRRLLPGLLRKLGRVDLFLHDSLHTFGNMTAEFEAVTPHLARPSILIADDVDDNSAYLRWAARSRPAFSAVLGERDKPGLFALAAFASSRSD